MNGNVAFSARMGLAHTPVSLVEVWGAMSFWVQVTVSPAWMFRLEGWNVKLMMSTLNAAPKTARELVAVTTIRMIKHRTNLHITT